MKHPYYNQSNAWRFVLVLYRISTLPDDQPLRITPKSSLNTARMRLFLGRKYILDSGDTLFDPYLAPATRLKIETERDYILVNRRADYVAPNDNSAFKFAFDFIQHFAKSNDNKTSVILEPALLPPQVSVLSEYVSNSTIRPAMITANQLVLTK
jgi:hypothetical protein